MSRSCLHRSSLVVGGKNYRPCRHATTEPLHVKINPTSALRVTYLLPYLLPHLLVESPSYSFPCPRSPSIHHSLRMTTPLINRPASPQSSNDAGIEEEDALLTGERTGKAHPGTTQVARSKWREIGLFVWAMLATCAVVVLAVVYQHSQTQPSSISDGKKWHGKRNLIFMVSDGMGPTSLSLTRSWRQYTDELPWDQTLFLDNYLIGQSRTRSTSSLITDSAAGATAFSCGEKSYNGAISVLPNFEPCGSK